MYNFATNLRLITLPYISLAGLCNQKQPSKNLSSYRDERLILRDTTQIRLYFTTQASSATFIASLFQSVFSLIKPVDVKAVCHGLAPDNGSTRLVLLPNTQQSDYSVSSRSSESMFDLNSNIGLTPFANSLGLLT